jgi:hypothetical protein
LRNTWELDDAAEAERIIRDLAKRFHRLKVHRQLPAHRRASSMGRRRFLCNAPSKSSRI